MSDVTPRAIVVGGSIAGLAAAVLLRRHGWTVDVYERSQVELKGRGAGIVTHEQLLAILDEAGADRHDLGVLIDERITLDATGRQIAAMKRPQIVTSWDRLQRAFRDRFPDAHYHLGHALRGIEQDATGVTALFEDREPVRADLLIAADGFRSAVRAQYAPDIQPVYAGYVIWRGVAEEADIPVATHAAIFDKFAFFMAPGQEIIGYPIAGAENDLRPGHLRYNWVWYRSTSVDRLRESLTDATGHQHGITIPPPLIRREIIDEMRESARGFMAPPMFDMLQAIPQPFFTPIYDHASRQMVFGRVALIGDAAFVARPHIGLGVTKAAADAHALVHALRRSPGDVARGLARFEAERKPVGDLCFARSRELGAFLGPPPEPGPDGAAGGHDHMALMRDTACDRFLVAAN